VEPIPLLLDDVMAVMKEGEVRTLSPVAREVAGDLPAVPQGASISYTVHVHSVRRTKPLWEMEASELLCLARHHKDRGTGLFKEDRVRAAAVCYSRAAKLAAAVPPPVSTEVEELQMALFLNLSVCQLKLSLNGDAFENCSRVLAVQPHCVKALYRRAVAAMNMEDLTQAEEDLREAGRVEPGNTAVQGRQRELARLRQLQNTRLHTALKSMFTT
jgi:tetratricopeptide (TPR) repeat protein